MGWPFVIAQASRRGCTRCDRAPLIGCAARRESYSSFSTMPSKLGSYWALSRAPRYSVTFALPLLLLYEGLAASLSRFAGEQMRNGADVMLRSLFIAVAGRRGPIIFVTCVIAVSIFLIARDLRRAGRLDALVFGLVIGTVTAKLLSPFAPLAILAGQPKTGVSARLMLSLGAGLYEELL